MLPVWTPMCALFSGGALSCCPILRPAAVCSPVKGAKMREFSIVTEVTSDLPVSLLEQHNIHVLPMAFTIGQEHFLHEAESTGLPIRDYFSRLRRGEVGVTSQVARQRFQDFFQQCVDADRDVLFISFSAKLSGNWQSGQKVASEFSARYPDRTFYAVDSISGCSAEGLMVLAAAWERARGKSIHEVYHFLEAQKQQINHWMTLHDLQYLRRGGRVPAVQAIAGTILGLKPVLTLNSQGHIVPVHKVRGWQRALDELLNLFKNSYKDPVYPHVFINHTDELEAAQYLEARLRTEHGVSEVYIQELGPITGAHMGPGAIGLLFFGTPRPA